MSIRIWHQSLTVLEDLGSYRAGLEAHMRRVARPDTEIVMHGMRQGTYQTRYPGTDVRHLTLQYLHGAQFVRAALDAQQTGFDAFACSTLPDTALRESRAAVEIPVVGYGESAMLFSCALGRRFGVLVFIPELAEIVTENAARYGLRDRMALATDVGFRFDDVMRGLDAPDEIIERFRVAARALIAAGADVIIPGEAPMCVLLARHGVHDVDGAPVLDSIATWIKMAESLVDLRRASGVQRARRGFFAAQPDPSRLREVLDFYDTQGRHLSPKPRP